MSAALEEVKERLKWFAAELVKVLKDDSLSPDQFYIELLRLNGIQDRRSKASRSRF